MFLLSLQGLVIFIASFRFQDFNFNKISGKNEFQKGNFNCKIEYTQFSLSCNRQYVPWNKVRVLMTKNFFQFFLGLRSKKVSKVQKSSHQPPISLKKNILFSSIFVAYYNLEKLKKASRLKKTKPRNPLKGHLGPLLNAHT